MLQLRITAPSDLTERVLEAVDDPAVSGVAVHRGASVRPAGDVVVADIAREAATEIIGRLEQLEIPRLGSIHVEPVSSWLSEAGLAAEKRTPGSSADAVVWTEVTQRAYDESELNWTYLSFMTLATLLASIAIVLDTQILVIGAMVLGPEFVAIAALGLALVRRRRDLGFYAARTLFVGFGVAIGLTTLMALLGRALGWIVVQDITGPRPSTDFIYAPSKWSFVVAVIAAAAGVLSLTSAKVGGLSGVFISVTTVPAAGNIALGLAFGLSHEIWGSAAQLLVNVSGMALAGWATLAFQQAVWARVSTRRERRLRRRQTSGGTP